MNPWALVKRRVDPSSNNPNIGSNEALDVLCSDTAKALSSLAK
jgi:hypothetical protein